MKRAVRNTRKANIEAVVAKPSPREKFMKGVEEVESMRQAAVPKFVAATDNQKKAVAMLRSGVRALFLMGSAGSGKSMLAAWWAGALKKEHKVDNIYLVRPNVSTGKSGGSLPGTEHEKLLPFFAQTLIHLETFMGKGFTNYCVEHNEVELKSGEFLRGRSFENCVVICEESQNFTSEELEMVLTRMGKNSTFIFTGDQKQNDLRGQSGYKHTIDLINRMVEEQPDYLKDEDLDALDNLVGEVVFTPDDCVRDGITRAFVKMYYHN